MSVSELQDDNKMLSRQSILHTIFFLLGFSSIFIMLGFVGSFISDFLLTYQDIIRQIGAIFIIFFDLVIVGIFNFEFLLKDGKVTFKNRLEGYLGSFIIGMAFSAGWIPCMVPILAFVLTLSATEPELGVVMLF